jgi:hypothetical protein
VGYDRPCVALQGVTNVSKENTASIFSSGRLPISPNDGVLTQKPVTYKILFVRVYECKYVKYVKNILEYCSVPANKPQSLTSEDRIEAISLFWFDPPNH